MNVKELYNATLMQTEKIPEKLELTKTVIAENIAIIKKKPIYDSVEWSIEQQERFDDFWNSVYGKRIPNYWHRLYQAASKKYAVDYIPEKLYSTKIEPALNEYRYAKVLEDKALIETISGNCGCVVPKTLLLHSNGAFYDANRRLISRGDAEKVLLDADSVVIKPTRGSSSGKGISFLEGDGLKESVRALLVSNKNDYIVQRKIKQNKIFESFNSSSVNTIRIITYIVGSDIHHVPIAFRIGRSGKQVDNIHAGGLVIGVSDDGTLLDYAYELGYGYKTTRFKRHPDNNKLFKGNILPMIPEIISAAYRVHERLSHIGIVSWDFTVDDTDNVVVIEANIRGQSIWFPQIVHGKGAFGEHTKEVLSVIKSR